MMDDLDPYRFEEEGTQEWFAAKTGAVLLPKPLIYRTSIERGDGRDDLLVEIVDPTAGTTWFRPRRNVLAAASEPVHPWLDWREAIGRCAGRAYDQWDLERSKVEAGRGANPYIGTFERG